jgi:hypothetical protein
MCKQLRCEDKANTVLEGEIHIEERSEVESVILKRILWGKL